MWLLGGLGGELYEDNSKVFYEHLIRVHKSVTPIWVARKGSPAANQAIGEIVQKGSVKNFVLFYQSRAAVFSDTFNHDIAPLVFMLPGPHLFYRKVFKVRLNHGNVAFKKRIGKTGLAGFISDKILKSYDLNTASTNLEQKVFETYTKIGSVVLTGSARNDNLLQSSDPEPTILIAPTWRPWLKNSNSIEDSHFFRNYFDLLNSETLQSILNEHQLTIKFHLHHMMIRHRRAFQPLNSSRIKILDSNSTISNDLLRCAILITDYSSLCAERYFVRRPVLFFQFDRNDYLKKVGSYIDLKSADYGESVVSVTGLIDLIKSTIEGGFKISNSQQKGERFFVHFRDRDNCARIYEEISKRMN